MLKAVLFTSEKETEQRLSLPKGQGIMELISMPALEEFSCAISAEEEEESTYITPINWG